MNNDDYVRLGAQRVWSAVKTAGVFACRASGVVALAFILFGSRGCTFPAPTPLPVPVVVDPALVILLDKDGNRVDDATLETAAAKMQAGTWRLIGVPKPGQKGFERTIVVGEVPPVPPPGPGPGPGPGPQPPPQPAPIPDAGFRVMVVFDRTTLGKLPPLQLAALYASDVQAYLDAKCARIGTTPEWRMFPSDAPTGNETKLWQDAFKRPRGSLPWVIISTGTTGYEGPLPPDKDKLLELLRKYAEPKTAMLWTEEARRAA